MFFTVSVGSKKWFRGQKFNIFAFKLYRAEIEWKISASGLC
jgi:hypothetical protein